MDSMSNKRVQIHVSSMNRSYHKCDRWVVRIGETGDLKSKCIQICEINE